MPAVLLDPNKGCPVLQNFQPSRFVPGCSAQTSSQRNQCRNRELEPVKDTSTPPKIHLGWGNKQFPYSLLSEYEDLNNGCPVVANSTVRPGYLVPVDPTISDPWAFFKRTLTYNADGSGSSPTSAPGYCYKSQPDWSAYRESSFGHGVLDVVNATYARW